jgi:hypothetical protein
MDIKRASIWLIVIFFSVLFIRLFFAFQTPYFSDDNSYYVLRQVEYITETGFPLYDDDLSYSGRTLFFSPFFHYLLAFFNVLLPITLVGKLIPNLLASCVVFAAYFVSLEITKQKKAALLTALAAGFLPIFFRQTINSVSVFSLLIPLLLATIYTLLKLRADKKYIVYFIIFASLFIVTDKISIILIMGLIFLFFLTKTEDLKKNKEEIEIILFISFLYFWLNLIIFKKAFLLHGISAIWQNIPSTLLLNYYSQINILESIYAIGMVPFALGLFVIYDYMFKRKSNSIYMLISIALSSFVLLWFRLIPLIQGLMILGIILILLFGQYIKSFIIYVNKSKFSSKLNLFISLFVILIALTSVIPSVLYGYNSLNKVPSEDEINALQWLGSNTKKNSTILTNINEGHLITYFSERKNVADSNYLLIDNIDQRVRDIRTIYTTPYKIEAVRLLNEYGVDYIYISNETKNIYGISELKYATNDCFNLVYNETIQIYESFCEVEYG